MQSNITNSDCLFIASLNFSGPNNSPFEYHDGSQEMKRLNEIFTKVASKYTDVTSPGWKWDVGKIDVLIKKYRYSILYQDDVGVVDGKLLNAHEFGVLWKYLYSKCEHLLKANQPSPKNIQLAMVFDWIAYESALNFVYGSELDMQNIKNLDPQKYLNCLSDWHSKSFLNLHSKIRQVCYYMNDKQLDVFFIQEAGDFSWYPFLPSGYSCVRRSTSMVCYKHTKIRPTANEYFYLKYGDKLNFNEDSCHLLCNENVLLISVHLTSKANNVSQFYKLLELINHLIHQENMCIIIGLDANHKIRTSDLAQFPHGDHVTTAKKRTRMQFQSHKSYVLVLYTKDYLLSTFPFEGGKVETITQQDVKDCLLPCDEHPFDHFVVTTMIVDPVFKMYAQQEEDIDVIVPLVLAGIGFSS